MPHQNIWKSLRGVGANLAPEYEAAFAAAFGDVEDIVSLDAIVAAIRAGNLTEVISAIDWVTVGARLQTEMTPLLRKALDSGGRTALDTLGGGIVVDWNVNAPAVNAWVQREAGALVTGIVSSSRDGIRTAVARAVTLGRTTARPVSAIEAALRLTDGVGLTPTQVNAVGNYRLALEGVATTSGVDSATARALDSRFTLAQGTLGQGGGVTPGRIDELVGKYRDRQLRWRGRNINRTETTAAFNRGAQEAWDQGQQQGALNKDEWVQQWFTAPDERRCPICTPLHGDTAALGELFVSDFNGQSFVGPPAHPQCRCALAMVKNTSAQAA